MKLIFIHFSGNAADELSAIKVLTATDSDAALFCVCHRHLGEWNFKTVQDVAQGADRCWCLLPARFARISLYTPSTRRGLRVWFDYGCCQAFVWWHFSPSAIKGSHFVLLRSAQLPAVESNKQCKENKSPPGESLFQVQYLSVALPHQTIHTWL